MARKNKNARYGNDCGNCQEEQKSKKPSKKVVRTAVIATTLGLCASAIVGLSVALYYSNDEVETHRTYQRQMDAVYSRAYYDLLDGASDMGITLRKISVSNSPKMQQSLLYEVWGAAELAQNNLGMFRGQDDGIMQAQKFVNQLGDYSRSLALRISDGTPLTVSERETLSKLGDMADAYERALSDVQSRLDEGNMFVSEEGGISDDFASAFGEFADPSINYPEMIYDGPFSDALNERTPYGLTGKEVSENEGIELLRKYLANHSPSGIEYIGQAEGDIKTYNYSLLCDGRQAFAQISVKGGKLIALNVLPGGADVKESARVEAGETCQRVALEFAKQAGYENMQVVWSASAEGDCLINLAPMQNGAVLYPDLVKVKVSEADNKVIGFDATHYAFNHHERNIGNAVISVDDAAAKLSLPAVTEGRLALIPLRGTKEVLTYEFECEQDGTYFVYIDAKTGEEANILYVISDTKMGERTQ